VKGSGTCWLALGSLVSRLGQHVLVYDATADPDSADPVTDPIHPLSHYHGQEEPEAFVARAKGQFNSIQLSIHVLHIMSD
jgi:hypothetical protein